MAPAFFLLLLLLSLFPLLHASSQNTSFAFNGFNATTLDLDGASVVKPSGVLKLTNTTSDYIGHAFYPQPIPIYDNSSGVHSFNTCFVFAIRPRVTGQPGGYGFAFTVAPKTKFPEAAAEHYLGLFNSSNDGNSSNHMLVVEFDTVNGYNAEEDSEGNHVGINFNGMLSAKTEPAAYYEDGTERKEEMKLENGKPIQAWIEYDAVTQTLNVTIAPLNISKPEKPLLSVTRNLTEIFLEEMYLGFSAATGDKRSFHYVLAWSFAVNGPAPPLNYSILPLAPNDSSSEEDGSSRPPYGASTIGLIVGLCVLTVCLAGILVFFTVIGKRNRRESETLENWELECPHRFTYKDLYAATKGFTVTERIGIGGFGEVYHGKLPATGAEVAVKKITSNNAIQGMREFVAEVESLGRLRHKNLVNLQGWCKHKNELLLIYDYVPHGSLFSLLYNRADFVLTWRHRFNILEGVASGLVYLHEEWEQVVIHRDVKSSNVLVDSDMNARLSDFGLARLHDHDQMSHMTNVVGTIGYIAPELARSGKASASSDVFAYGILLLEVACGAHPIGSGHYVLADRVLECYEQGRILDMVDGRMGSGSNYNRDEVELVLKLGLLCSHPHDGSRPRMRQVVRYLNGDDPLPVLDASFYATRADPLTSRFLEAFSSDSNTSSSYVLSSAGGLSTTSFRNGR